MKKDAAAAAPPSISLGKLFLCLESKPILTILFTFSLLILLYNLHPSYYQSLLSTSSSSCHCSLNSTTVAAVSATPFVSLSSKPTVPAAADPRKLRTSFRRAPAKNPNKREFKTYGNAAALFVQMGAYRGGVSTFSVVGLASKPTHVYGKPWYKCEWVSNRNGSDPIRAKAYKILPDWGYGRVYTVVVVNCTFPTNPNADNSGGKLMLYAYYSLSPRKYEKFTALEESIGSYDESKFNPPFKYDYLYCGSSLYGTLSASRVREWMAYHAMFFGARSHFVFHDAGGVTDDVRAVLEPWVKLGRVTVQDIRGQDQFDGYYYNQFLVVNDCLHRYRYDANWTFFFDVDEYMFLPKEKSLEKVMMEFENYTQFTIEQNPMASKLCLNESNSNLDYSSQWGFEKLVFRDSRTRIRRDRKYAIKARNAYATGVHMSENVVGEALHKTDDQIRYYHYHNTIQVKGEPCRVFLPPSSKAKVNVFDKRPYIYDDNMKKIVNTVKQFERQTLGHAR